MKSRNLRILCTAIFITAMTGFLRGHAVSEAWLRFENSEEALTGTWSAPLHDLDFVFVFDRNADGSVTWEEITSRQEDLETWIAEGLQLSINGEPHQLTVDSLRMERRESEAFLEVALLADPLPSRATVQIEYDLLTDYIPDHRAYFALVRGDRTEEAILRADRRKFESTAVSISWDTTFVDFFREGVWHIWIGYDHLLFLGVLLLPAVARREDDETEKSGKSLLWRVIALVTAFSIAHSITLALSILGWAELPGRAVEIAIAASVAVAALASLFPKRWTQTGIALAFGFGLLHGFGFAGVLGELDLAAGNLLATLLAFNLGVEAGQIAVVLALFPILLVLRQTRWYRPVLVPAASVAIAMVACFWIWERAGLGGGA